jgi:hypothetical protein
MKLTWSPGTTILITNHFRELGFKVEKYLEIPSEENVKLEFEKANDLVKKKYQLSPLNFKTTK